MSQLERTGVVVIRVWIESPGLPEGFRARITLLGDLEEHETESVVAATPDESLEIVRAFLDGIVAVR